MFNESDIKIFFNKIFHIFQLELIIGAVREILFRQRRTDWEPIPLPSVERSHLPILDQIKTSFSTFS